MDSRMRGDGADCSLHEAKSGKAVHGWDVYEPDFPFCDVSGFVSGEPGTCIAVNCTPGQFGECRGDNEVRCNEMGTNYDVVQCERGCDPTADGCRLCDPNETVCANGQTVTCDASGSVVSNVPCALGCFQSEPRCRDIVPSNELAAYADMVPNPPDMDLSSGSWIVGTDIAEVVDGMQRLEIPSFLTGAPTGGVQIRV
jgi:hypothetical protein